jgi:multiple sugar transport system permease protein
MSRRRGRAVVWYAVAIGCLCLFVFPFVLLLLAVFKSPAQAAATPAQYWPRPFTFGSFDKLFGSTVDIGHYVGNSLVVSAGTVAGTVVLTVLGGYGFHRYPFRGSGVLFAALLTILMVPFQSIITPLYVVLDHVHLLNSLLGLTLVYVTYQLPFGLFVMRNAFSSVPAVISEAAEIDGASTLRGLWHVQLPLVVPGILTVSIFAFIAAWNDFIAALILLSSQSNFTLPVELLDLVTGQFGVIQWGVLEAGVLISMVPCVALFLVLQRHYMGGLLSGAVK